MTPIKPEPNSEITAAEFYEKGRRELAYVSPEEMAERAKTLFSQTYQKAKQEGDGKLISVASNALNKLRQCTKDYSV